MEDISIYTDYIRLDAALKLSGLVDTGGQGKALIQGGQVLVNGEPCSMRGKRLRPGDCFSLGDQSFRITQGQEKPF